MRISIIGPAYPLRGGIAHHVFWLSRELRTRGHQVQVISFRRLYPGFLFPGTTEFDTISELKFDPGAIPVLTSLNPLTWSRAKKLVKEFRPAVVVFQWWQPFFAPLIGTLQRHFRRVGIQTIAECHNVFPHEGTFLDRALIRFGLAPSSFLITHSQRDRELLLSVLPGKHVGVSSLPTFTEFAGSSESSRQGKSILFFGKIRKYKGLDVLLQAMPRVLSRVDCTLRIIGEFYEPVDRFIHAIDEHNMTRNVRIENRYVSNEEVIPIFHDADLLVLPYVSASQSAVARIALSNALPIIASRVGGLSEVVEDGVTGTLVPPNDPDALADAIVDYFNRNLGPSYVENIVNRNREDQCSTADLIDQFAVEKQM